MFLSTKTRYGLRAMVELASREGAGPVLIDTIAMSQEISRKYLDAIFSRLRESGLIQSQRGAKGGVMLAKPATTITVADVVRCLDGPIRLVDCGTGNKECGRALVCVTQELWKDLSLELEQRMESVTVGDLAERLKLKEQTNPLLYYI